MVLLFKSKVSTTELFRRNKRLIYFLKPRIWMEDPSCVGHVAINQVSFWIMEMKVAGRRNSSVNSKQVETQYSSFLVRVTQLLETHYDILESMLCSLMSADCSGFQSYVFLLSLVTVDNDFNSFLLDR